MKKFKNIALLCVLVLILAGCSAQQSGKVEYIGPEAAKALALDAAGLTDRQVKFSGADMNSRNNMDYYQVSFVSNGENYQYDIDALTGMVIESKTPESQQSTTTEQTTNGEKQTISKEEAKNAALAHAGVSADQVTFVKAGLDWDDGRQHYDVEFYTADYTEYDYDIDAYTGAVLSFDKDAEYYTPPAADPGTQITADEAKAKALAQVPGATLKDIREFSVDYDDGRLEYEGTIYYNKMEYEFEIDGYSGAIRSWEVESIYD